MKIESRGSFVEVQLHDVGVWWVINNVLLQIRLYVTLRADTTLLNVD